MADDLDDLSRRAQAVIDRNRGMSWATELECPVTCSEVLALIERCRAAEADATRWREYRVRREQLKKLLAEFVEVEE